MTRLLVAASVIAALLAPSSAARDVWHNQGPRKRELWTYTGLYFAVKDRYGTRAPGRNVRRHGVRTRYGSRPATAVEVSRSIRVFRRWLAPPAPPAKQGGRGSAIPAQATAAGSGCVALGHRLQAQGYMVGEHPAFGGVAPVHVSGSAHYSGHALDINGGPGGEPGSLDRLAARLGGYKVLWRVAGHFDHLHVECG